VNADLAADPAAARVMQDDLLLAEIVGRMNDEMRMILEGLLLGYTFEEMPKSMAKAQTTGGPSSTGA
jgi:hypothetical protein